ncbi:MAG: OmpA family protein [Akkermansiaceae bacterium]
MKIQTFLLASALILSSCAPTLDPYTGQTRASKAQSGAILGGLLGAGIGALSGDGGSDSRQKALVGAGIGALAGAGIGNYMDQQEALLRQELESTGVSVTRQGSNIILNMSGDITFPTAEAQVMPDFFPVLNSVSKVLNSYHRTLVEVTGHTDNIGARNYNYRLSQQRATNVADYLRDQRVDPRRFKVSGLGPDQPAASNDSVSGRQLNRRVTIELIPLPG